MGFQLDDRVFHFQHGEGSVDLSTSSVLLVTFANSTRNFLPSGKEHINDKFPTLSHTPYNLIDGGFSIFVARDKNPTLFRDLKVSEKFRGNFAGSVEFTGIKLTADTFFNLQSQQNIKLIDKHKYQFYRIKD